MSTVADASNKQVAGAAPLVAPVGLAQELLQASVVVIALAIAILIVGTPIALTVRALHDIARWLLLSP